MPIWFFIVPNLGFSLNPGLRTNQIDHGHATAADGDLLTGFHGFDQLRKLVFRIRDAHLHETMIAIKDGYVNSAPEERASDLMCGISSVPPQIRCDGRGIYSRISTHIEFWTLPTNARHGNRQANLKTGRFVPIEIRIVAEENEALQSVGLEEHFARHPFSFDRELVHKSVDGSDDSAVNHIVASRPFDIVSDGFGEQPELGDGVLAAIRGERRLEISVPIRDGERQPILFRVPHAYHEELYSGDG